MSSSDISIIRSHKCVLFGCMQNSGMFKGTPRDVVAQDSECTTIIQVVLLLLVPAVLLLLCGAAHSVQLGQQAVAGPSRRAELQGTAMACLCKHFLPGRWMWSITCCEGDCRGSA